MATTKQARSAAPRLDPDALYRVDMLRVVVTAPMVYRPGEEHHMTGAQLTALAAEANASVDDIARATLADG